MICCFFGNRNSPSFVKEDLRQAITNLIKEGIKNFYVGNNGNFDFYTQCVLEELAKEFSEINYSIVLSHIEEKAISGNQQKTVFPDGFEYIPPKFSVSHRNDWMIKHSSVVIVYSPHSFSNSFRWAEKAYKKGLRVISLSDRETDG